MNRISRGVNIVVCVCFVLIILLPAGRAEGASENASKLLELARKKFGTLTEAEEKLFRASGNGELADYRNRWENNYPVWAENWGDERVLRADRLAWLCTDREASAMVTHWGIWVVGARINGNLDLSFARILFPLKFEKSAFPGIIDLHSGEIEELVLYGTHTGPINANELKVKRDIFLNGDFEADGGVSLDGATIGGDLNCDGGRFINAIGYVLSADAINVKGNVFLSDYFWAEGRVSLVDATIGGNLNCNGGMFINPSSYALDASGIKVNTNVFLREGFMAKGMVSLVHATIDGFLELRYVHAPELMTLDLRSARVGILRDDANSWPDPGKLFLHGFVYGEIDYDAPRDAASRIDWLRRQPGFRPQPYEQLAEVLRKSGQDVDVKKILIAKDVDRARLTKLTWSEKCWYRVLWPMIDYGYRPLNALWGVLVFVALGWVLFGIGHWGGLITPQSESAYVEKSVSSMDAGTEARELSDVYPRFNFLVYSVDTFVPLIDLHQAKYWLPNANRGPELLNIKAGGLLRLYLWIHITVGWALTMLLVAGLTGLVRT